MRLSEVSVLIVEDVNAMQVQIKEMLKTFGFEKIHLSSNGAEALEWMSKNPVHVALVDWHMEPMTGLDLLKMVRADGKLSGICVVMVTADSTKESVVTAIKSGVDEYLVKPITAQAIEEKIIFLLTKKKVLS